MEKTTDFRKIATEIRKDILKISYDAKVGHVGSAFSIVEILVALYYKVLAITPKNAKSPQRDRFILSKGHAAPALYAILYRQGFINKKTFTSYCQNGGLLEEHPTRDIKGIEAATGSLGHGLSLGIGMALSGKIQKKNYRVFVLLSDAECDEGETWEAILSAAHFKLNNLFVLLDYNKVQAFGKIKDVLNLEPLTAKWNASNWNVIEVDGHNTQEIINACNKKNLLPKPTIIICHTIRGKGVSFMEHTIDWHYLTPTDKHLKDALNELNKL